MIEAYQTVSWKEALLAMGLPGIAVLAADLVMLAIFVYGLVRRRMSWALLWIGGGAVVAGILGTVLGVMETYAVLARKGGAANAAELSWGMALSLIDTAVGLGSLLLALILTGILHACRRPEDPRGG